MYIWAQLLHSVEHAGWDHTTCNLSTVFLLIIILVEEVVRVRVHHHICLLLGRGLLWFLIRLFWSLDFLMLLHYLLLGWWLADWLSLRSTAAEVV